MALNILESDRPIGRRDFMKACTWGIVGVAIVGMASPVVSGCNSLSGPGNVQADYNVSSLTGDNQALVTTGNGPEGSPLLIVRKSATSYVAVSMNCTHEGCTLDPPSNGVMLCSCHGSEFDTAGAVLRGPARSRLTTYTTTYDAGTGMVHVNF
ncbi:MAG TPA: Rieske 2Fe-2S domain-containing protein [Candidatus Kapabacteria bacterium]|nr:Rieske 2Fe-2S domain-containing protein [Candidatus Kapabacteria bacterium]